MMSDQNMELEPLVEDLKIPSSIESDSVEVNENLATIELPEEIIIDDDELILKNNGEPLDLGVDYALIKQFDHVISYKLENFLKENGKPKSPRAMNAEPPVLVLEDSDGNEANFVISKELASNFAQLFSSVEKAYFGIDTVSKPTPVTQKSLKEFFVKIMNWAKTHPVKSGLLGLIIVAFIIGLVF